jgi:hexosaminidase
MRLRSILVDSLDALNLKPFQGIQKVKKIEIKIPNYGAIPEGNQGAGNKAWTFIDELIIN